MTKNNLSLKLSNLLIQNNKTISFAESCTGGLLAYHIIKNPNVSSIINQSYIVYSNEVKSKILNVKNTIFTLYGAVSKECVIEMARGLFNKTKSDYCVSISGIAGPNGGSDDKPVGTVYMAILYNDKINTFRFNIKGNRQKIQKKAVKLALQKILEIDTFT